MHKIPIRKQIFYFFRNLVWMNGSFGFWSFEMNVGVEIQKLKQ